MASSIIDAESIAQFDDLQMEGYPDILLETIVSFMKTSPARIDAIQNASKKPNWKELGAAAHALKSSAYTLGAKKLGELCEKLEDMSQEEKGGTEIPGIVKEVVDTYSVSCSELDKIRVDREAKTKT